MKQIAVHRVFLSVGNALGEVPKEEWAVGIMSWAFREKRLVGISKTIQDRGLDKVLVFEER